MRNIFWEFWRDMFVTPSLLQQAMHIELCSFLGCAKCFSSCASYWYIFLTYQSVWQPSWLSDLKAIHRALLSPIIGCWKRSMPSWVSWITGSQRGHGTYRSRWLQLWRMPSWIIAWRGMPGDMLGSGWWSYGLGWDSQTLRAWLSGQWSGSLMGSQRSWPELRRQGRVRRWRCWESSSAPEPGSRGICGFLPGLKSGRTCPRKLASWTETSCWPVQIVLWAEWWEEWPSMVWPARCHKRFSRSSRWHMKMLKSVYWRQVWAQYGRSIAKELRSERGLRHQVSPKKFGGNLDVGHRPRIRCTNERSGQMFWVPKLWLHCSWRGTWEGEMSWTSHWSSATLQKGWKGWITLKGLSRFRWKSWDALAAIGCRRSWNWWATRSCVKTRTTSQMSTSTWWGPTRMGTLGNWKALAVTMRKLKKWSPETWCLEAPSSLASLVDARGGRSTVWENVIEFLECTMLSLRWWAMNHQPRIGFTTLVKYVSRGALKQRRNPLAKRSQRMVR